MTYLAAWDAAMYPATVVARMFDSPRLPRSPVLDAAAIVALLVRTFDEHSPSEACTCDFCEWVLRTPGVLQSLALLDQRGP